MKKLLFSLVLSSSLISNAQVTFEKTYSGKASLNTPTLMDVSHQDSISAADHSMRYSMQHTTDGGYIRTVVKVGVNDDKNVLLVKSNKYGNKTWEKTFGGAADDFGGSVKQTTDHGYVFTGSTNSFGSGGFDVQLVKTDSLGNEIWTKTFGGAGDEFGESVQQTANGGYVIAGKKVDGSLGTTDVYVIETDSDGNLIWEKTYGGTNDDKANSVRQTADGGYFVAGETKSFGAGSSDLYLIKLDSDGNEVWAKAYGGAGEEEAEAGIESAEGGFVVMGQTNSFGEGLDDIYIVRTDNNGDVLWTKTLGGAKYENLHSFMPTADKGYILTGSTTSYGVNGEDVFLIKTDSTGSALWGRTFGGQADDEGHSVQATADGYAVVGTSGSFSAGKTETYFIKTDNAGNTLCDTNSFMPVMNNTFFTTVSIATNSTYTGAIVAGAAQSTFVDSVIVMEDMNTICAPNGSPATGVNPTIPGMLDSTLASNVAEPQSAYVEKGLAIDGSTSEMSMNVYPNPGAGTDVNVSLSATKGEEVLVVVYDAVGRENFSKVVMLEDEGNNVFAIDPAGKLTPGIYFVTATSGSEKYSKKLIIK